MLVLVNNRPEHLDLLDKWRLRARTNQKGHYMMAERLHRCNLTFGLPVIGLSALVGSFTLATLAMDLPTWATVLVGTVSVSVAATSALQTFLKFSERAEDHRAAAIQFGIINRELERLSAFPPTSAEEALQILIGVETRLNELAKTVPAIPLNKWKDIPKELTPDEPQDEKTHQKQ